MSKKKDTKEEIKQEQKNIETSENIENNKVEDNIQEPTKEELIEQELAKEKDKYLRLFAEFENYKRRTTKERIELFKTAGQDILSAMLPVLDDFDRAISTISQTEDNEMLKGVELIHNKLVGILKNKGLEQVEVAPSDTFDSEMHEAITQIPASSEELKGKIIEVIEKGYKLGDKIIRYPKVVVAQ